MKVLIVPMDSVVKVDGVKRNVDVSELLGTVHAVKFDTQEPKGLLWLPDGAGQQDVTDYAPYQKFIDRWVAAEPPPVIPPLPVDQSDLDNLEKGIKALAMCVAQVGGMSNAQMKTLFKQKWDSLP